MATDALWVYLCDALWWPPSQYTPHCKQDPLDVFPEIKLPGFVPNFRIHVSVSDLYIFLRSVCLFCCNFRYIVFWVQFVCLSWVVKGNHRSKNTIPIDIGYIHFEQLDSHCLILQNWFWRWFYCILLMLVVGMVYSAQTGFANCFILQS